MYNITGFMTMFADYVCDFSKNLKLHSDLIQTYGNTKISKLPFNKAVNGAGAGSVFPHPTYFFVEIIEFKL